jgi:hypothetical protein
MKSAYPVFAIVCLIAVFALQNSAWGQNQKVIENLKIPDSLHVQIITTLDGSSNIGRISEIMGEEIRFVTDWGILTIPISRIKEIKENPIDSIKKGEYWFPNPNTTRLFFAPTARMLEKGEGYFQDIYVFFAGAAYGCSNSFTLGGGASLIPGANLDEQVFYLTPKVGIKAGGKLDLAAGALLIRIPSEDEDAATVGILYGVGTFGGADASVTAGLGYGFADNELADKPVVMLGGESRISKRLALVSENWIFPGVDHPLVSYGVRFFGPEISVDLAFFNMLGESNIFPGIPYIDFVFNF